MRSPLFPTAPGSAGSKSSLNGGAGNGFFWIESANNPQAGPDTLFGGSGDDVIQLPSGGRLPTGTVIDGGGGNDTLAVYGENGVLRGSAGRDLLQFDGLFANAIAKVRDFTQGTDQIGISKANLLVGADAFELIVGRDPTASGTGPALLFDTETSLLSLDPDGLASYNFVFARLEGVTSLAMSDFILI